MIASLLRRALAAVPAFIGITLTTFFLVRLIPGDPVQVMTGRRALDAQTHLESLVRLGLDRPLLAQYLDYVARVLRGDLGESIVTQTPVWTEFLARFPATVELTIGALLIALILGLPAGVAAATRRGSLIDQAVMTLSAVGSSMPIFWWGLLLIMTFAVDMRQWAPELALPVSGRIGLEFDVPVRSGFMLVDAWLADDPAAMRSALLHMVLPAIVLGTGPLAAVARMTRSSMLEVIGREYVRAAHARGLVRRRVVFRHALPNALIPVLTTLGLVVGSLLGGAVFTETLFSWPGIGKWTIDAIFQRDYPVLQAAILIGAMLVIAANAGVDMLHLVIEPQRRDARPK